MDRDVLGHLPVVLGVARHRSFAAAAAELGMSPSAVSHAVRTVEDRLSTPLFARTTRSVSLTEAGARFIASVEPALVDIDEAIEKLTADHGQVTGLLRISAVGVVLEMALPPILTTLAQLHPRRLSRSTPTKAWWTSLLKATTPASGFAEPSSRTWSRLG
jgi:DNA-binding transcriptional LysR family regulator